MTGVTGLLVLGTRRSWARLVGIVAGVATGVLLALLLVAGANALETRDLRASWLNMPLDDAQQVAPQDALAARSDDAFTGHRIKRLDLAVPAGTHTELPLQAPEPGSYLASPALQQLIDDAAPEMLEHRFGRPAGLIPDALLASPDSLVVIVGGTVAQVASLPASGVVTSFGADLYGGNDSYRVLAVVGALALLIPAFLLISVATALGAAARAERWQTLRTIGAASRVLRRVARAEALGTALIGAGVGLAAFFAVRPAAALLPVAGERLLPADLTVSAPVVATVLITVVVGSLIAASWSVRRSSSSPATIAALESRPGSWRLLPLVAGIAAFALANPLAGLVPVPLIVSVVASFALLAIGLLVAGPWLTWAAGALFQRLATSGTAVVASRRIVRTPRSSFRSVAGLVAATFVITVFAFAASAHVSADDYTRDALLPDDAVAASIRSDHAASPAAIERALQSVDGAGQVAFTHTDGTDLLLSAADARALTGADVHGSAIRIIGGVHSLAPDGPGYAASSAQSLQSLPISDVIVRTDDEADSIERVRTTLLTLDAVDPASGVRTRPEAVAGSDTDLATQFTEIGRLAIVVVTVLAAAVLTMSTVAALHDRRRTLALLHLIGMPRTALRRVIAWETAIPLLGILTPTIALGWFTAWHLIASLSSRSIGAPDPLLAVSLIATAVMAAASILIAARAGRTITRTAQTTRQE